MSPLGDLEQYATFCFYLCKQESDLYMLNMREQTHVLFKRLSWLSLLRLVWKAILGLLTLQILTATVLLIIAALGKRRKNEMSFPHQPFMEQWKSRPWYNIVSERILAPPRFMM